MSQSQRTSMLRLRSTQPCSRPRQRLQTTMQALQRTTPNRGGRLHKQVQGSHSGHQTALGATSGGAETAAAGPTRLPAAAAAAAAPRRRPAKPLSPTKQRAREISKPRPQRTPLCVASRQPKRTDKHYQLGGCGPTTGPDATAEAGHSPHKPRGEPATLGKCAAQTPHRRTRREDHSTGSHHRRHKCQTRPAALAATTAPNKPPRAREHRPH